MLNMFIPLTYNLLTSMKLSKSPMSHNRDQTTYLIKLKILLLPKGLDELVFLAYFPSQLSRV